jgi:hypothetical protein
MPPLTDERTRGNVIREWILGFPRDQIAEHIGIGAGTVSTIIANYKTGLEELDFDSIRQLALEVRKQGLNWSDLASHFRLSNFIKSGTSEESLESFLTNVSSIDVPSKRIIELVNQIYDISKSESVPPNQLPDYVKQKLEEKQEIDEQIKEAERKLQSKNLNIQAINEHLALNEKLKEHGLSIQDIDRLVNVLINVKEYDFDGKKIVAKLRKIKRLDKKEKGLENNCTILSRMLEEYKEIVPLSKKIVAMNIGIKELLVFDNAVNQIAKKYNLPTSVAASRLLNEIRDYDKIGGMKSEISRLSQQLIVVDGICTNRNKAMRAVLNLQSLGISEDHILYFNNILENMGMKSSS